MVVVVQDALSARVSVTTHRGCVIAGSGSQFGRRQAYRGTTEEAAASARVRARKCLSVIFFPSTYILSSFSSQNAGHVRLFPITLSPFPSTMQDEGHTHSPTPTIVEDRSETGSLNEVAGSLYPGPEEKKKHPYLVEFDDDDPLNPKVCTFS